ncbi:hypothetical protein QYE76_060546 [Lolium multiflorum]|uniref:F-box domain-containing protein n=1 Tax=Lolium multiflorum TaxID=4521 RepID=A0AAD8RZ08_LOLMU|nr:hypothetical protein QYE76_060546 [Lolium multiflorum]
MATHVLPIELIEEILLRLPLDDPVCLLRASLVCQPGAAPSHTLTSAAASTSCTAHPRARLPPRLASRVHPQLHPHHCYKSDK